VRLLVAAGGPAGALLQETAVIDVPNQDLAGFSLLLNMTFQTERGVAFVE